MPAHRLLRIVRLRRSARSRSLSVVVMIAGLPSSLAGVTAAASDHPKGIGLGTHS
jgi:hypothetical protein